MANNPYVNKVQLANGTTLIDLSGDTVTSATDIVAGKIGHLASGEQVTGTASGGGVVTEVFTAWEPGDIHYSTGMDRDYAGRIRTIGSFVPESDCVLLIDNPDGDTFGLRDYRDNVYQGNVDFTGKYYYAQLYPNHAYRCVCTTEGTPGGNTAHFYVWYSTRL